MSRSFYWDWELTSDDRSREYVEALFYWNRFFTDCPLPVKYVPSGGAGPERVHVLLYANRAKARRIATYLDRYFGRAGELRRWQP